MTFSDAEEDQPSSLQNREHSSENSANPQPDNANEPGAEGGIEVLIQSCPTNTDNSEAASPSSMTASYLPILNGSNTDNSNMNIPGDIEVLDRNLIAISVAATSQNAESLNTVSSTGPSDSINGILENGHCSEVTSNEASACGNSIEDNDLESEKIKEKLEQIQGYIQQTAIAMQALESEGNMDNIGKYDTLVKVMRDLKYSESKLNAHLNVLKEKSTKQAHQTGSQDSLFNQFEALFNSLQIQENECAEALDKTLLTLQATDSEKATSGRTKESGSESIGVVGSFNGDSSRPSLHERLNHHQHEQEILSARLRESLLRRQELMTRYQATRERLNNLKRKRLGITQEERSILQSAGASETPYEDPIPGAESWTLEQLESAVQDFIVLREKVDRVHHAYIVRLEAVEEGDSETPGELNAKIEQLLSKRFQIENALTQMRDLITAKRDGSVASGEINNFSSEESTITTEEGQKDSHAINADNAPLISERVVNSVENLYANVGNRRRTPSENSIPARESDEDIDTTNGAQALTEGVEDLQAKQKHLQSLKQQLNAMKQLLLVTQEASCFSDSQLDHLETDSQNGSNTETLPEANDLISENSMIDPSENLISSTVVGLNGTILQLSESEKRDPLVVSKYLQLAQAKERLAKMEEVMKLIAEAGDKGLPLDQVLSPENMAILTEAREEEDVMVVPPLVNIEEVSSISGSVFHEEGQINRQTRSREHESPRNQINGNLDRPTIDQTEWERDRKISAMQFHLKKKTPAIPSVNDGSRIEPEKGAEKKQARNLFCEGGNDPRVTELMALQEELKEKKNALEALMNKMGKSSSFTIDNISDNILDNVSDGNSGTVEKQAASWGAFQGRSCTDLYQSEDAISRNVADEIFNTSPTIGTTSSSRPGPESSAFQHPVTPKNQNQLNLNAAKSQFNPDIQQFSVNNLNGSLPRSVRPKHNLNGVGIGNNIPIGLWDGANANNSNIIIKQDPNTKVQNTVSAALSQLSQVQETINSLYDELRGAEQEVRQPSIPPLFNQSLNTFGNNVDTSSLPHQLPNNVNAQNGNSSFSAVPPPINNQGLGDSGATNHLIAGLQQCFSQLYLHSLEIQSLNKHLQILDQKKSTSPTHRRIVSQDRRSEGPSVTLSSTGQTYNNPIIARQISKPNFSLSSLHLFENDKPESTIPHHSYHNRNENSDELLINSTPPRRNDDTSFGVNNPLYDRISNNQPSSWSMPIPSDPNLCSKNFFTSFNDRVHNDERRSKDAALTNASSGFPMDSEDGPDNMPWAWGTESLQQMNIQQSSDILNNQVLPGTRANNYWDNFRSYSHQNPLSTATKCNTGARQPATCSSTPGAQPLNYNGRARSTGFENRQYNLTSGSNNSINKASDKNGSHNRSQNKGARSRYPHQTNSRRSTLSDSHLYNLAAVPTEQRLHNDSRKRNNRQNYVSNGPDFLNHGESSRDLVLERSAIENMEATERDRVLRSQRLCNAKDSQAHHIEQHSRHVNLERQNANSHEYSTNSEAYNEVVREAESLMQKHSHQPQFLLQLFHHASQITSNTDQHVALELLRELSYERHQSNISNNRWNSNSSVTQSENLSSGMSATVICRNNYRNDTRFPNKNSRTVRGISGSDTSESGMSSDEEERDRKSLYQMMKNFAPTTSGDRVSSPNLANYASPSTNLPSAPQMSPLPPMTISHNQFLLSANSKTGAGKDSSNLVNGAISNEGNKSEIQNHIERSHRLRGNAENTARNFLPNYCSETPLRSLHNSYEHISHKNDEESRPTDGCSTFNCRKRKSPRRDAVEGKSNFVLKNKQKNFNLKHPITSQSAHQGPVGFESIVSAALREVLRVFEWPENNIASNGQVLETLHRSIMTQVDLQSKTLGFSSSFVSSVDSQLKATLQGFYGKRISHVRQELAATVTQVLIHQYCSLLVTQSSADYIQPQTPDSTYAELHLASSNTEADESLQNTTTRHQNNQPCLNSLFGPSEGVIKQSKPTKSSWSFSPNLTCEGNQMNREEKMSLNMGHHTNSREEKSNPVNLSRGRGGAIAKTSSCSIPLSNENFVSRNNAMGAGSPTSDASYPESWILSRASSALHAEGNLNSSSHETYSCGMRGRNGRDSIDASEIMEMGHNDTEADQGDHSRTMDFHNSLLPVHDLAEADQSQDVHEAECVDSSAEDEIQEAAGAYGQAVPQTQDSPIRLMSRKNLGPTSGLDEVPTRLLSGPDGASPPLGNSNINGRHPPEGLASSNETRNRPGGHGSIIAPPQFSPSQSNSHQHQFDGRHPPDGQNQAGQQQQTFNPSDSAGNTG